MSTGANHEPSKTVPPLVDGFYKLTDGFSMAKDLSSGVMSLRQGSTLGFIKAAIDKGGDMPTLSPLHTIAKQQAVVDEEAGTITQAFRMLSATYIPSYCTDFYTEATKLFSDESVALFENTPIYVNHGDNFWDGPKVEKWLGKARNARLGEKPVRGIDADFIVNLKQDEHLYGGSIRRGLEGGVIDCCSVTVWFTSRRSHPKLDAEEFWWALGTEVDGQIVRFIVERIKRISEVSFVYAGADPFARSLSLNDARHHSWKALSLTEPPAAAQPAPAPQSQSSPAAEPPPSSPQTPEPPAATPPPAPAASLRQNPKEGAAAMALDNEEGGGSFEDRMKSLYCMYELTEVLALEDALMEIAPDEETKQKYAEALNALQDAVPRFLDKVRAMPAGQKEPSEEEEEEEGDDDEASEEEVDEMKAAFAAAEARADKVKALRKFSPIVKQKDKLAASRPARSLLSFCLARFGVKDADAAQVEISKLSVKAAAPKAEPQKLTVKQRREALLAEAKKRRIPPAALLGADKMSLGALKSIVDGHPGQQPYKEPQGRRHAASAHPGGALGEDNLPAKAEEVELSEHDIAQFKGIGVHDKKKMQEIKFSQLKLAAEKRKGQSSTGLDPEDDEDDDNDQDDE